MLLSFSSQNESRYVCCLSLNTSTTTELVMLLMRAFLMFRCTSQSECTDAAADNRWKSLLIGAYNSCVNIIDIQPAAHWPLQRSSVGLNVRRFIIKLFVNKAEIPCATVAATVAAIVAEH